MGDDREVNRSRLNDKLIHFGSDVVAVSTLTSQVRASTQLPVIVKLSPMVSDIASIARAIEEEGADAVSLINTVPAMGVDVETRKPKLANVVGGLSGPAIKPIALRQVWQVYDAVKIPVIGMGGIMTAEDVLEFMIAGSSAVQIGTANFVNPLAAMEIIEALETYAAEHSLNNLSDLTGSLRVS